MRMSFASASLLVLVGCNPTTGPLGKRPSHSDMAVPAAMTMDMASPAADLTAPPGGPPSLTITPNPATVTAQVQNGTVTTTPVVFSARDQNGNLIIAAWQIDRGELGTLSPAGAFTANGLNGGVAHVTATAGALQAMAPL